MAQSKTYKLPVPELLEPANAPVDFEKLARAVEGQAYPSLQAFDSFTGDVNVAINKDRMTYTLYSEQIPSSGVVGWVDIDAYCITTQGYPPLGTAGAMAISVNGARVGFIRYHNYWIAQNMPVWVSARWANPSGAPVTITVEIGVDSATTPEQFLMSKGMSYQIYGARVY